MPPLGLLAPEIPQGDGQADNDAHHNRQPRRRPGQPANDDARGQADDNVVDDADHLGGGQHAHAPAALKDRRLHHTRHVIVNRQQEVAGRFGGGVDVGMADAIDGPLIVEVGAAELDQARLGDEAHEGDNGQQHQGEGADHLLRLGQRRDQRQGDDGAGDGAQVDAGPCADLGHGHRPGPLQGEVLGRQHLKQCLS